MDDGSPDVKTSVAMLRRLQAQKVTAVCATPHYYRRQNAPTAFCLRRAEALGRLLAARASGPAPGDAGGGGGLFPPDGTQPLGLLCVEGTRTLLLEMPFADWTDLQVETVTTLALDCRYDVVLAHPERFCFSQGNRRQLARLAALPVGLQVNADSLLRRPLPGPGAGTAAGRGRSPCWAATAMTWPAVRPVWRRQGP